VTDQHAIARDRQAECFQRALDFAVLLKDAGFPPDMIAQALLNASMTADGVVVVAFIDEMSEDVGAA